MSEDENSKSFKIKEKDTTKLTATMKDSAPSQTILNKIPLKDSKKHDLDQEETQTKQSSTNEGSTKTLVQVGKKEEHNAIIPREQKQEKGLVIRTQQKLSIVPYSSKNIVAHNYWEELITPDLENGTGFRFVDAVRKQVSRGGYIFSYKHEKSRVSGQKEISYEEITFRTPPLFVQRASLHGIGLSADYSSEKEEVKRGPEGNKFLLVLKGWAEQGVYDQIPNGHKLQQQHEEFNDRIYNVLMPLLYKKLWEESSLEPQNKAEIYTKLKNRHKNQDIDESEILKQCIEDYAEKVKDWRFKEVGKKLNGKTLPHDDPPNTVYRFKAPVFYPKKSDKNSKIQPTVGPAPKQNIPMLQPASQPVSQSATPITSNTQNTQNFTENLPSFVMHNTQPKTEGQTSVDVTVINGQKFENFLPEDMTFTEERPAKEQWETYHSLCSVENAGYTYNKFHYVDGHGERIDKDRDARDIMFKCLQQGDLVEATFGVYVWTTAQAVGIQLVLKNPVALIYRPKAYNPTRKAVSSNSFLLQQTELSTQD